MSPDKITLDDVPNWAHKLSADEYDDGQDDYDEDVELERMPRSGKRRLMPIERLR